MKDAEIEKYKKYLNKAKKIIESFGEGKSRAAEDSLEVRREGGRVVLEGEEGGKVGREGGREGRKEGERGREERESQSTLCSSHQIQTLRGQLKEKDKTIDRLEVW